MQLTTETIATLEADRVERHERALAAAATLLELQSVDPERVIEEVRRFSVAAPSWALGTGGTRFARFPGAGEPRTIEEKLDDVAVLNALTGANRTVSLHVPWDDDGRPGGLRAVRDVARARLRRHELEHVPGQSGDDARRAGLVQVRLDGRRHEAVRDAAVEHNLQVVELGAGSAPRRSASGSPTARTTPARRASARQFDRVADCLRRIHDALPDDWLMFTEHKPYEPAFYATVVADWGSSLLLAQAAGPRRAASSTSATTSRTRTSRRSCHGWR